MKIKRAVLDGAISLLLIMLSIFVSKYLMPMFQRDFNPVALISGLLVLSFLFSVYFARDHIRTWFKKGKLEISPFYFLLPALLACTLIPPLGLLQYIFTDYLPLYLIVFWYNILLAFRKENPEQVKTQ